MPPPTLEDLQNLSPSAFEQLVKKVFDGLGYEAAVTGRSGDEGVDLVLERGDERSIAQCKRYKGQVGQSIIREFFGAVVHEKADRGYVVTTGTFSLPAQTWAYGKNIILVDGIDLVKGIDSLDLQVVVPAQLAAQPDELSRLGNALRDARDGKAYLRLAILGAPPTANGYIPLAQGIEDLVVKDAAKKVPDILNPDWIGARADGGFVWFEDNVDADRETLCRFVSEVIERVPYETRAARARSDKRSEKLMRSSVKGRMRRMAELDRIQEQLDVEKQREDKVRSMPVARCHLVCTVWDPKKLKRFLPLRQRMKFDESIPLQIEADLVDWADADAWIRKVVAVPPATEEQSG